MIGFASIGRALALGLSLATLCLIPQARAQNSVCPDVVAGDISNKCANTRFVGHAVNSPALLQNFIFVGSAANLATGVPMSGDCGIVAAGIVICTKTNGVPFGVLATVNYDTNFAIVSNNLAFAPIPSGDLLANNSAGSAEPTASTLTAYLDRVIGSSNGMFTARTGGAWGPATFGTGLAFVSSVLNLQPASAGAIGGVNSIAQVAHNWVAYIDTAGLPHQSQPAFGDLTGTIGAAQFATGPGIVSLAMLNNTASGAVFTGNPGASAAARTDFTLASLTNLASPSATLDLIPIVDHTTGTIKNVTPFAIATSSVAGVASLGGLTGVIGCGTGITCAGATILETPTSLIELTGFSYYLGCNNVITCWVGFNGGVFVNILNTGSNTKPAVVLDRLSELNITTGAFTPQATGVYEVRLLMEGTSVTTQSLLSCGWATTSGVQPTNAVVMVETQVANEYNNSHMMPLIYNLTGGTTYFLNCWANNTWNFNNLTVQSGAISPAPIIDFIIRRVS